MLNGIRNKGGVFKGAKVQSCKGSKVELTNIDLYNSHFCYLVIILLRIISL